MNKQRKTSHILNVFQYDADGHVVLPASLTLGIAPTGEDNSGKVPTTAWVRSIIGTTGASYVPTGRTITINGTSYDLSSNRSWSIDTGVLTASAGSGISVSVVSQNLNIVNTGLLTATSGSGISVSTVNQNLNIVNTGLLTATAGAGISVSTVSQNLNIVNTGLLTATAGSGITVSVVNQNLNVVNTGILTASAGSGISLSVVGQNLNVVNTGVLTATAGAGISLSIVDGNLNVVNTITNNNQLTNGAGYITSSALTGYATETYVGTAISNLVDAAPGTLDTLNELAAALGDDPNFATTVSTSIGTKVPQTRTLTINGTSYDLTANRSWTINSMVYPSAGIALSTGTAWGTSITDNSANWNTAYGWGNHASAGYAASSHTHSIANVTGLQTALDGKQASGSYAASSHSHIISDVTGLQTALDGKQASLGYTPYNATNPNGYITGISFANVSSKPTTISGYGITDAITTGNIASQSVSYASSTNLLNSLSNYVWSASTLPSGYNAGIQTSFVSASEGFPSYGSVLTNRTYTGSQGGTLQLFTPYGPAYGGTRLGFRSGIYETGAWSGWKYLLNDSSDPYAANMNQYVRTTDNVNFNTVTISGKITTAVTNGTIISHGSMTDAFGYNNSYGTYIGSAVGGTYYIYGNGQMYNNGTIVTLLHSSNYSSYALPLSGGTLSNTLNIGSGGSTNASLLNITGGTHNQVNITNGSGWGLLLGYCNEGSVSGYHGPYSAALINVQDGPLHLGTGNSSRAVVTQYGQLLINAASSGYGSNLYGYNLGMRGNSTQAYISVALSGQTLDTQGLIIGLDTTAARFHVRDSKTIIFANADVERMTLDTSANLVVNGSVRAPIFYDTNDTAYYLNPAGGSRLRNLYVGDSGDDWSDPGGWGTQVRFSNGPHVRFVLHARTPGIEAGMYVHTPSSVYIGSYTAHSVNMMVGGNSRLLIEDGRVYSHVYMEAAGSMRAPIFYDSNDTGYYLDPAGYSNLGRLRTNSSVNDSGTGAIYGRNHAYDTIEIRGYGSELMIGSQGTDIHINYRTCNSGISGHTPVNWYWRAGASNNYSNHYFGEVYANGWFRTTGSQGLYNPTNDAHFYPNTASYGSWRIDGSKNGWHGLHFASGSTLMMNGNETGVHREGYGWQWRWDNGTFYIHGNSYGGGTGYAVITAGNIGSQSVSYASSAGSVAWTNVSGRPTAVSSFSNDSGYVTSGGEINRSYRGIIQDTRGGQRSPNDYDDYRVSWEFTNQIVSGWHSVMTLQGWHDGYAAWQIIGPSDSAHENWYLRSGNNTSWNSLRSIIHSGNISSQTVSNSDMVDGYHASNFLGYNGNSYYQVNTWLQMNGTHGIYYPSYNGAHFYVNTTSSYTQFRLDGSRGGYGGIWDSYSAVHGIMYDSGGNGGVYREANGLWYFYYHLGNNCMGVGTSTTSSSYKMYVNGTVYATGDVIAYSDRRKKTNIETIKNALEKVTNLRGVFYDKIGEESKGRQLGVIAQEVDEVLPEAVNYAADVDEYGVKYGNMVGVLIEAIKEQQKQIEELQNKLDNVLSSR